MSMWRRRFLWPDITVQCSGDERGGKMVDGAAKGEVRSETGKNGPFQQRDDRIAVLLPLERPSGVFAGGRGTLARPDSGARTPELTKPRHNSGSIAGEKVLEYRLPGSSHGSAPKNRLVSASNSRRRSAQELHKIGSFSNVKTVLPLLGLTGAETGAFSWRGEPSPDRVPARSFQNGMTAV